MGCPEVIRWTTLKPVSFLKKLFLTLVPETNETELKPVSVKQKRP